MISEFDGQHRFLSNFAACQVSLDGCTYRSVEHAFQAAKTFDLDKRLHFQASGVTASQAKRMGRTVAIRPDWENVKLEVMEGLLRQKFDTPYFRDLLLGTEGEELVEGNWWGDVFWGQSPLGKGQNHLGKLLMKIRQDLQQEDILAECTNPNR